MKISSLGLNVVLQCCSESVRIYLQIEINNTKSKSNFIIDEDKTLLSLEGKYKAVQMSFTFSSCSMNVMNTWMLPLLESSHAHYCRWWLKYIGMLTGQYFHTVVLWLKWRICVLVPHWWRPADATILNSSPPLRVGVCAASGLCSQWVCVMKTMKKEVERSHVCVCFTAVKLETPQREREPDPQTVRRHPLADPSVWLCAHQSAHQELAQMYRGRSGLECFHFCCWRRECV